MDRNILEKMTKEELIELYAGRAKRSIALICKDIMQMP